MKIVRLSLENFRCIKNACIHFDSHTLMVGPNNVGKSTICEALDLVLGPERLNKYPQIEEFDFYNSKYLEDDGTTAVRLRVEVIIIDLNEELISKCGSHIEFWNSKTKQLLLPGEISLTDDKDVEECIRLETLGQYVHEEDEFEAQTYFSYSPLEVEVDKLKPVGKNIKRLFGFLYLRALRTGSRALTLERGSLLDLILRLSDIRTGLWEETIKSRQFRSNDDIHYTHAHNKQTTSKAAWPYQKLGIKHAIIVDFDMLRVSDEFKQIIDQFSFPKDEQERLFKIQQRISQEIESQPISNQLQELLKKVQGIVDNTIKETGKSDDQTLLIQLRKRLDQFIDESKSWHTFKQKGKFALSSESRKDFDELEQICASKGLFIVPVGEVESWLAPYGVPHNKGKKWIADALVKLATLEPDPKKMPWLFIDQVHRFLES